jgi:hypothetical protein
MASSKSNDRSKLASSEMAPKPPEFGEFFGQTFRIVLKRSSLHA